MNHFNYQQYLDQAITFVYSFGGPSAIVLWLSNLISNSKLEKLKSKHAKELEDKKAELSKSKSRFHRYSERQFNLYNDLWLNLNRTRDFADELWENPSKAKLPGFADQIRQTRRVVTDNMLLIEESHYQSLDLLLKEFENFQFGKQKLIDIRTSTPGTTPVINASDKQVRSSIDNNRKIKEKYTKLIFKIGQSFRDQIRG